MPGVDSVRIAARAALLDALAALPADLIAALTESQSGHIRSRRLGRSTTDAVSGDVGRQRETETESFSDRGVSLGDYDRWGDIQEVSVFVSDGGSERFVLRLEGSRASHGILLRGLEEFIDDFLQALRRYDRASRGDEPSRGGRPERRDELVTAFRLVAYEIGSAVVTIEPAIDDLDAEEGLPVDAATLPASNLESLLGRVRKGEHVAREVAESLESARRRLGDDGRFQVSTADRPTRDPVRFDEPTIRRLTPQPPTTADAESLTISGRLHAIDLEPERVLIRAADGTDWRCDYRPALEATVTLLIGGVVVARGEGRRRGPRSGDLRMESVQAVEVTEQTTLFTMESTPFERLMGQQAIDGPQGLDALADPMWDEDDDSTQAFVEALIDR